MSYMQADIIAFVKGMPIAVRVEYKPLEDPFSIRFIFLTPEPQPWDFDRDLLLNCLDEPTGVDKVKFRPAGDNIIMSLRPNKTTLDFSFQKVDIDAIIQVIKGVMPKNSESDIIDWDGELKSLLDG